MNQFGNRGLGDHGARLGLGPAVFWLLLVNVAVFLLQMVSRGVAGGRDPIAEWFAFVPYLAINELQIWRFFTYMFLHAHFWHIALNMLGLWLFGSRIEAHWGTRTFTWYYLASGIGGGLLYGIFSLSGLDAFGYMLGASGAVYGLLLAFGLAFPNAIILMLFIPMPARIAVIVFGVISLLGIGGEGIAHLAHLGGMLTGLVFLWLFTDGHPGRVPRLPGGGAPRRGSSGWGAPRSGRPSAHGSGSPRSRGVLAGLRDAYHRWRTRQRLRTIDGQRRRDGSGSGDGGGRSGNGGVPRDRVDQILEKISKQGLQSLTPEEQDILRRASRKH